MCIFAEWIEIIRPLATQKPVLVIPFVVFPILVSWGIVSLVVGAIVEAAAANGRKDRESDRKMERERQMSKVKSLIKQILELDSNHDGTISAAELGHEQCEDLFADIDLPNGFANEELHQLLDDDGSGEVTLHEFLACMFRLIYSNDFQRNCLTQLSLNRIKRMIVEKDRLAASRHDMLRAEVRSIQQSLLREIRSSTRSSSFELAANGEQHARSPAKPRETAGSERVLGCQSWQDVSIAQSPEPRHAAEDRQLTRKDFETPGLYLKEYTRALVELMSPRISEGKSLSARRFDSGNALHSIFDGPAINSMEAMASGSGEPSAKPCQVPKLDFPVPSTPAPRLHAYQHAPWAVMRPEPAGPQGGLQAEAALTIQSQGLGARAPGGFE